MLNHTRCGAAQPHTNTDTTHKHVLGGGKRGRCGGEDRNTEDKETRKGSGVEQEVAYAGERGRELDLIGPARPEQTPCSNPRIPPPLLTLSLSLPLFLSPSFSPSHPLSPLHRSPLPFRVSLSTVAASVQMSRELTPGLRGAAASMSRSRSCSRCTGRHSNQAPDAGACIRVRIPARRAFERESLDN